MSHPIHKHSALARPVEAKYPTNRAVLIILPAVLIGVTAYAMFNGDAGFVEALVQGLYAAGMAFLAWALGREIDPDHNASAFVAMGLGVWSVVIGYQPDLLSAGAILFAIRVVNRTVGPPAKPGDLILMGLLVIGAVFLRDAWWVAALCAIALAVDEVFERSGMAQRGAIVVFAGLAIWSAVFSGNWSPEVMETLIRGWIVLAIVITLLFAGGLGAAKELDSLSDFDLQPLKTRRVQAGLVIAWMGGVFAFLGGQDAVTANLAIWTAMAGASVGRTIPIPESWTTP